ncbi:hypothetical protein C8F01DRAFT_1271474 [Mycena amicta]|nr:hypothetical protein C8F01DRAFT_1271474 [Mycena amicta]
MARPSLSPPPERLLVPIAHTPLGNPTFPTPICFVDLNGPVNLPIASDTVVFRFAGEPVNPPLDTRHVQFRGIPAASTVSASSSGSGSSSTGPRSKSVLAGGSLKRHKTPDNVGGVTIRLIEDGTFNEDTFAQFRIVQEYPGLGAYRHIWPVRILVREALKDSARQHENQTNKTNTKILKTLIAGAKPASRQLRSESLANHTFNAHMELVPSGSPEQQRRRRSAGAQDSGQRVVKLQAVPGPTQQQADAAVETANYSVKKARQSNRQLQHTTSDLAHTKSTLVTTEAQLEQARREIEQLKSAAGLQQIAEKMAQEGLAAYVQTAEANMSKHYETQFNLRVQEHDAHVQDLHRQQAVREQMLDNREKQADNLKAEQENLLAALTARLRLAASNDSPEFPRALPQMVPQLTGPRIREQRRVAFIARNTPAIVPELFISPQVPDPDEPMSAASGAGPAPTILDFDNPRVRTLLVDVVKEVLSSMGYAERETPRGSGRRPGAWDRARKATQARIGEKSHQRWLNIVLEFWRAVFGRSTYDDFANYQPVSLERVAECAAGKVRPDPTKFILDFESENWRTSAWNLATVDDLRRAILETRARDPLKFGSVDVPTEYIDALLHGCLKRSQEPWKMRQQRDGETKPQTTERVKLTLIRRQQKTQRTARKHQKLAERLNTVQTALKILQAVSPTHSAGLKGWEFFAALLEILGTEGMSSEESDTGEVEGVVRKIYRVKRPLWRSPQAAAPLATVDDVRHAMRIRGVDPRPRKRVADHPSDSHRYISTSDPPSKRPASIFNTEWLENVRRQQPLLLRDLELSNMVFVWEVVSRDQLGLDELGAGENDWNQISDEEV